MKKALKEAIKFLKRNKAFTKSISFVLSLLLIFYVIPSTIYAQVAEMLEDNSSSIENITDTYPVDAIYEIETLRESNAKHFRLADGSYVIARYNDNVHYLDENGKWEDIDNTISSSLVGYTIPSSEVKFEKKITGNGKLYTINDADYKLTFSLENAEKGIKATVINGKDAEDMTEIERAMNLEKTLSRVIYYGIQDNTDIEYVLHGTDLKENIIVNDRRDSYEYKFELKMKNLVAELDDGGNVVIRDKNTYDVVYIIPSPVVYDSIGQMPTKEQAYYTLTGSGNKYSLTVTVDANWMNSEDTLFPVVIDPTVEAPDNFLIEDTSGGDTGDSELLYVHKNTDVFWRMVNLPQIPSSAHLTNVKLRIPYHSAAGHFTPSLKLRKVESAWSESTGVEDVVISDTVESVAYIGGANQGFTYVFDITDLFHSWYENPESNFGVALSYYNIEVEGLGLDITTRLYSSESTANSLHFTYPSMEIGYLDIEGIEGEYSYLSQSMGYGGLGYINLANGSLNWQISTLSTTSPLLSYAPVLIYNSSISNLDYIARNLGAIYDTPITPTGYKLNISEAVIVDSDQRYLYEDADGTRHILKASDTEDNSYHDTEDLNMKFVISTDSITLTDDSHLTKIFVRSNPLTYPYVKTGWCLSEITDEYGNKLIFTLDSLSRPTEISLKPVGSQQNIVMLKLVYGNEDRLSMIYNPKTMDAVILRYSETYNGEIVTSGGKYLKQIEFTTGIHGESETSLSDLVNYCSDGSYTQNISVVNSASYTYNEHGQLTKITDDLSCKYIEYTWENNNIVRVSEGSQNDLGQTIIISYNAAYTTVRNSGNDDVILNGDDTLTRYIFDEKGRVISVYSCSLDGSEIYGAKAGVYDDESREDNLKHQSTLGGSSINYLLNGDFEEYDNNTPRYWNISVNVYKRNGYPESDEGYNTLSFTPSAINDVYASQIVFLPKGRYTLSMTYASVGCVNYRGSANVTSTIGSGLSIIESISLNEDRNQEKVLFSTSFEISDYANGGDTVEIKFAFSCDAYIQNSDIRIDNVMLCNSEGASDYSLVSYGNFTATSYGNGSSLLGVDNLWYSDSTDAYEYTVSDPLEFGDVLKIKKSTNEVTVKQRIYQITDNGLEYYGTQDFVSNAGYDYIVSGFAYAPTAISGTESNSKFRIGVDVYYYQGPNEDDVLKTYYFDFLPGIDAWQFTSGSFSTRYIPEDNTDTNEYNCISAIDVFCEYSDQINCDAYFDNIAVIRADTGNYTEYYYYSQGISEGLPAIIHSGSYYEYYIYDDHKNITVSATSEGDMMLYNYDQTNVYQLNSVTQCRYSYGGSYVLPINLENPLDALEIYYKYETRYSYDQYGNVTSISTYSINSHDRNYEDTSPHIYSASTYDLSLDSVMFGAILSETDETGATVYYYYDQDTCRLRATANSLSGNGLVYSYDEKGALSTVTPGSYVSPTSFVEITDAEKVEYTYGEDNSVSEISTATSTYGFTYDSFGNRVRFDIGENTLATYEYADNNGKLQKLVYGNGFTVEYVYNDLEMLDEIWYDNNGTRVKAYEYGYTADGLIQCIKDNINGVVTEYTYDHRDRVSRITSSGTDDSYNDLFTYIKFHENGKIEYVSTHVNVLSGIDSDDTNLLYLHYYDSADNLISYVLAGHHITTGFSFDYDDFQRLSEVSFTMSSFNADYTYTYKNYGEYTTSLIESVTTVINETTAKSENYTYDADGNITKITYSNGKQIIYTYDNLGQLISENNDVTDTYYTYTYDNAGNIIRVTETDKTPNDGFIQMGVVGDGTASTFALLPPSLAVTTYNYSYTDSEWGDLLTKYNGVDITYDEIGNPLSYYNGSSYTFGWQGRRLVSAVKGSKAMSFSYNDEGFRTSKTVNGVTTNYYYQGSLLVAEERNSSIIVYFYDENGSPFGYQYRAADYEYGEWDFFAYEKNIFGDIVAVYDENGTKLVSYVYDAWGKCKTTTHATSATAAVNNPYRYRGYYYDSDLGMYYLQTRYYDAEIGRFINADGYISTGQGLLGYNMFAYCGNNPVNKVDYTGTFPIAISIVSILLVVCCTLTIATVVTQITVNSNSKEKNNVSDAASLGEVGNKSNKNIDGYTVYALKNPITENVEYIGRTKNPDARENAHRSSPFRGHLTFVVLDDNLSKAEARGLEQYYMILYHTLNTSNKANNQINGISLSNPSLNIYVEATIKYIGNKISNEFLNWAGI